MVYITVLFLTISDSQEITPLFCGEFTSIALEQLWYLFNLSVCPSGQQQKTAKNEII